MNMSLQAQYNPTVLGFMSKNSVNHRAKSISLYPCSVTLKVCSVLVQTCGESENPPEPDKPFPRPGGSCQAPNHHLSQPNTIGIIGGASAFSTLVFLEKLVWWSSRRGNNCPPFVVCSDTSLDPLKSQVAQMQSSFGPDLHKISKLAVGPAVESLKRKMAFLERSGASCVVMPCLWSHVFHSEIVEGSSLAFLHIGECVAKELLEAKLKPLEVGSNVKIGLLATNEALAARIYQDKLRGQGFEVVLPDKATMEHIVIPSVQALKRRDMKGARNLLRIALQTLLMRAANTVVIASDEMQGLLPHDDPLLRKCTDPMDSLARSTIKWAISKENMKI